MKKTSKRYLAAALVLAMVGTMAPVVSKDESKAATKKYTVSKKAGTYSSEIKTKITAKKGYKVYYTTSASFKSSKVVKSGKSKKITVKKTSVLKLIVVKKAKKLTTKKLNSASYKSKIKKIKYTIDKDNKGTQTPTESPKDDTSKQTDDAAQTDTPTSQSEVPAVTTDTPASQSETPLVQTDTPALQSESPASTPTTSDDTTDTSDKIYITLYADNTEASTGADGAYEISKKNKLSILKSGIYSITTDGEVDGQIVNEATDGDVTLILNGVNLSSANYGGDKGLIMGKKNTSHLNIYLADGTINTLTNTGDKEAETDDNGNATGDYDYPAGILIKKGSSLTIGGTGTLNINSTYGNGIKVKYNDPDGTISTSSVSDDNFWAYTLTIEDDPTINISCYEGDTSSKDPSQDAIHSKNSLLITGGKINIKAGDDGIHAEAYARITGGDITVSKSTEALEGARVIIDGGDLDLTSSDDGINAANGDLTSNTSGEDPNIYYIKINGGNIKVNAEGDGLDSNGNFEMNAGYVIVNGPSSGGNGALDVADQAMGGSSNGTCAVNGGTLIAMSGTSDMTVVPSNGSQSFVTFTNVNISAGSAVTIKDSSGNTVDTFTPDKKTAWLTYSGEAITKGAVYTAYVGDSVISTSTAGQNASAGFGPGGMMPGGMNPGGMGGFGGNLYLH